ncbi:hypothetical protein ACQP2U_30020 [Nocardia sp. CA-084685]|uniref:hypothetical protein n=1 Tax=Nocardia sp. CA-084685 TaxID=3239970 RepID=UPI003D95B9A5
MISSDAWRLLSYAVPESERAARHQLRRRLCGIGCGTVSGVLLCARDGRPHLRPMRPRSGYRVTDANTSERRNGTRTRLPSKVTTPNGEG